MMGPGLSGTPSFPSPSPTHSRWQLSRLLPLLRLPPDTLPSDGRRVSFRSSLSDPAHSPPPHPHVLHISPPNPAPHGEGLRLFCSPLFLWNLEKWPIHSRDLIHEQMHERVVENFFKVASLLTEKRFAFIRLSVFIPRSLSLLLEQLPRLP